MFILIPTTTSPHQTHSFCLIHSKVITLILNRKAVVWCIKMEGLSLKGLPLSLWIFLPSPRMTALGTLLLNILKLHSQWLHLMWKRDHSKRKTDILPFSVLKVQLKCSLRKKRERKKKELFLVLLSHLCTSAGIS